MRKRGSFSALVETSKSMRPSRGVVHTVSGNEIEKRVDAADMAIGLVDKRKAASRNRVRIYGSRKQPRERGK